MRDCRRRRIERKGCDVTTGADSSERGYSWQLGLDTEFHSLLSLFRSSDVWPQIVAQSTRFASGDEEQGEAAEIRELCAAIDPSSCTISDRADCWFYESVEECVEVIFETAKELGGLGDVNGFNFGTECGADVGAELGAKLASQCRVELGVCCLASVYSSRGTNTIGDLIRAASLIAALLSRDPQLARAAGSFVGYMCTQSVELLVRSAWHRAAAEWHARAMIRCIMQYQHENAMIRAENQVKYDLPPDPMDSAPRRDAALGESLLFGMRACDEAAEAIRALRDRYSGSGQDVWM